MQKNAQMMMGGPRKPLSLVLGLILIVFGGLFFLKMFGVVGFSLPTPVGIILWVISIAAGIVLLWDALGESTAVMGLGQQMRIATFVLSIILLAVGLIPLLNQMGVVGFAIPVFGEIITNALFLVTGGLALYGGTQGF